MEPLLPAHEDDGGWFSPSHAVVIPTIGRPCLQRCLDALAAATGPPPAAVILADDRQDTPAALPVTVPVRLSGRRTLVVTLEARRPAAARNAGWRAAPITDWLVFLDDDVEVGALWAEELAADLALAGPDVAGVQGAVSVPVPPGRRPAGAERATVALATARWSTADLAVRRAALLDVGGFDERFPRAFREDIDLALRLLDHGWRMRTCARRTTHPLRPGGRWASFSAQAGNADDAAMSRVCTAGGGGTGPAPPSGGARPTSRRADWPGPHCCRRRRAAAASR